MNTRLEDVACTVCGCVCDDLTMDVRENRIAGMQPDCPLARHWFLDRPFDDPHPVQLAGRPAERAAAVVRAARVLGHAKAPLIYGLSRSSTPGQRAAVRLADRIGATIDTTASTCHAPSIMALQVSGESTCTLGEIRNRSDLVVYWGSNPVRSHPRHIERYLAPGQLTPRGRADRRLIVIDTRRTETTEQADTWIRVEPGGDLDVIWALRMLLRDLPLTDSPIGGVDAGTLGELAGWLRTSRYGAIFFGLGLTRHGVPHATVEGLLRLVIDLNAHTRFVARRMRVPGDVAGADSVLCWQTGFPFSVNLARGYPRYNPDEYSANRVLARGEADAALLVGSEGVEQLDSAAQQHLRRIPTIVLDYPHGVCPFTPDVHFTTAIYGVHRSGTAYRMDEVPIPLRPLLHSELPTDDEVLGAILAALGA